MAYDFTTRFRVEDVVEYLGGLDDTANLLGVHRSAVSHWRKRDCFPPARALQLSLHFGLSPEFFHDPWYGLDMDVPRGTYQDLQNEAKAARQKLTEFEG